MGMFDYLRCTYPLPPGAPVDGYQTKDTPSQWLDTYEIKADGTLWGEEYEFEDRSDKTKPGLLGMVGCLTRVNVRPVQLTEFTGEIRFGMGEWGFSAYFVKGELKHLETLSAADQPPAVPE
jgi:hypothetical protein